MGPGEVVRMRNISDKEWSDMYANITYSCPAGSEVIVPFEAMCLWLGHPDAVDMDGYGRDFRNQEWARLRIRYGIIEDKNLPTTDIQWETNRPKFEVFDIANNVRAITVCEDPEGRNVTPAVSTVATQEAMAAQMEAMRQQMLAMQAQLDATVRGNQAVEQSSPIPDDGAPARPLPPQQIKPPVQPSNQVPPVAPPVSVEEVSEDLPNRPRVTTS